MSLVAEAVVTDETVRDSLRTGIVDGDVIGIVDGGHDGHLGPRKIDRNGYPRLAFAPRKVDEPKSQTTRAVVSGQDSLVVDTRPIRAPANRSLLVASDDGLPAFSGLVVGTCGRRRLYRFATAVIPIAAATGAVGRGIAGAAGLVLRFSTEVAPPRARRFRSA
jgi:hypothetical protein